MLDDPSVDSRNSPNPPFANPSRLCETSKGGKPWRVFALPCRSILVVVIKKRKEKRVMLYSRDSLHFFKCHPFLLTSSSWGPRLFGYDFRFFSSGSAKAQRLFRLYLTPFRPKCDLFLFVCFPLVCFYLFLFLRLARQTSWK